MDKEFPFFILTILLSCNLIFAGPVIDHKGGYIDGPSQNQVVPTMPSMGEISINLPTTTQAQEVGLLPPVSTRKPPKKFRPKPSRKDNSRLAQDLMKGLLDGVETLSKAFTPRRPPKRNFNVMNELSEMTGLSGMSGLSRMSRLSGLSGLGGMSGLSEKSGFNGINGIFEMLFTGGEKTKPPPKNDDFLSKLLFTDKKQSLQISPTLISDLASQAGKFFTDLPSQIVSQAFQMVMDNLLTRAENFILSSLGRFDEYMLTVIKAFVMEALMQFQGTLLEKLKTTVLHIISVTEIDTVTKVLRTISAVMNEEKLNVMSHLKNNIFSWMQMPPMFQMFF